jgi:hypothetical protein
VHLFHAELHTLATSEMQVRRAVRARRLDVRAAGLAQGTVPVVHDDVE